MTQPSWEKQVSKTIADVFFSNTPKLGVFFGKIENCWKLTEIRVPGLSNWTLRSEFQQFRLKVCQAERNICDRTGNPWAFVFSFRTESICASRQRSYVPTPPPHNGRLFLDFGAIFSQVTLNFLVNTIRQVIWPSPSQHFEPKGRQERTSAGRWMDVFMSLRVCVHSKIHSKGLFKSWYKSGANFWYYRCMTVFTKNSTHPISSKKENSDLAVQIRMEKPVQFEFVPRFF